LIFTWRKEPETKYGLIQLVFLQSLHVAILDGNELYGRFRNRNKQQGGGESILNRRETMITYKTIKGDE
jgi:hypothetical protein